MNDGLIPYRYAKALYKSADEKGETSKVYEEMKKVAATFAATPSLQKSLANPFVSRGDKEELLKAAAGPLLENNFESFIRLVLDHHRAEFFWRMALAYEKIYRDANNISQVELTTASQLPEAEMMRMRQMVQKSFPGRKLEFTEEVNPALIGGFVINVDHVRMDASLSNEIEQLRHQLITGK